MEKKMIQTDLYNSFKCIGNACDDTCCAGWSITVDREKFELYKTSKDVDIKSIVGESLSRVRGKGASEQTYAKMDCTEDGKCRFLLNDGLCQIHKKLGPEALCKTCATFPREIGKINNSFYATIDMACPVAAEMLAKKKNKIKFELVDQNIANNVAYTKFKIDASVEMMDFFERMKNKCVEIIQDDSYSLWKRLVKVGMLLNYSCKCLDENNQITRDGIKKIYDYMKALDKEDMDKALRNVPLNVEMQADIMRGMMYQSINCVNGKLGNTFFSKLIKNYKYNANDSENVFGRSVYSNGLKKYYYDFMNENEIVLENYIVNRMFAIAFPRYVIKDFFKEYKKLLINILYIKYMFIAEMEEVKRNLTAKEIKEIIYTYDRGFKHNQKFMALISEMLEINGVTSMAHFTLLLKE